MFFGAGTVFGRACAALIKAFREGDSLDMLKCMCVLTRYDVDSVMAVIGYQGTDWYMEMVG